MNHGTRGLWTVLFDGAAILLLGDASRKAIQAQNIGLGILFASFAAGYSAGFLMHIMRHRTAQAMNIRLQAAGVYLFTAFVTAVSADDLMYMASANGHPYRGWWYAILVSSLAGSLVLCLSALLKPRYGSAAGLVGVCLVWPYVANLVWNLPWHHFVWLVAVHWDGKLHVQAVLSLIAATAYSIAELAKRTNWVAHPELA